MSSKKAMKPSDASRIQSTQAKSGNPTGANTFPSRSQSAAATNVNRGIVNPTGGTGGAGGNARSGSPKTTPKATPKTTPASTTSGGKSGGSSRK
ncbi:hypothetical protein P691DRAFT_803946 [Macrolepiota fuliginosa MF-IS2]|uniref:SMP domain-containing protein n=1 Tax=Macrolepiota fuliginosa MF-IS2 TaxID=1400762 RepID=A0A9P5XBU5_9AGAR|nr:hypothetical protein P691DRAFT_803946 [Macrolepiota fuliginosa MF-IS2]